MVVTTTRTVRSYVSERTFRHRKWIRAPCRGLSYPETRKRISRDEHENFWWKYSLRKSGPVASFATSFTFHWPISALELLRPLFISIVLLVLIILLVNKKFLFFSFNKFNHFTNNFIFSLPTGELITSALFLFLPLDLFFFLKFSSLFLLVVSH